MTDVVLNKKILGKRAGTILPYTKALEGHVKAGNATVLPAEHEADRAQPRPEQFDARPTPLALAPSYDAEAAAEDDGEDTAAEDDGDDD